jgi:carbamate kinase
MMLDRFRAVEQGRGDLLVDMPFAVCMATRVFWEVSVEAVIDEDLASAMLAEQVGADLLVIATDVAGVYIEWATPAARRLGHVTPEELSAHSFPSSDRAPLGRNGPPG